MSFLGHWQGLTGHPLNSLHFTSWSRLRGSLPCTLTDAAHLRGVSRVQGGQAGAAGYEVWSGMRPGGRPLPTTLLPRKHEGSREPQLWPWPLHWIHCLGRARSTRLGVCCGCQGPCAASASRKGWPRARVRSLGSSWVSEAQELCSSSRVASLPPRGCGMASGPSLGSLHLAF